METVIVNIVGMRFGCSCLLGRQCRSDVGQTAAQITGNQENENAKGMKNRSEKMKKLNRNKDGMIIFKPKNDYQNEK